MIGVQVITPTHYVEVALRPDGEMVNFAQSHYGAERTTPEHEAEWHRLTGTPAELEIVSETYAILQRLNETQTLALITATNYEATPLPLRTPDGNTVTNTPFVNVTFSDARGVGIVNAQYRMEPSGPGLVRWWHWPPATK